MILDFRQPPVNDNEPPFVWVCRACSNIGFVMYHEHGFTSIRCGKCGEDVTAAITPTLPIEISLT